MSREYRAAVRALRAVGNELQELGLQAWCERYRVPLSFVEALDPPEGITGLQRFQAGL